MGRKISNKKRALLQLKEQIVGSYQGGGSLKQVADWFDSSVGTIRSILVAEGVELRPQGRQKKEK